jgi:hypothetical protein
MGKRELKKQYTELNYNFVDLVSLLDTTPTKKMTPFLVKQFNDWIQYTGEDEMEASSECEKMRRTLGDPKNELDEIVKRMVFKWAQPKLEIIQEFTEHMEANRLEENDINKYSNWNAIKLAVNEAEIKQGVKNKKNRVTILHQDEEWLVLKPLSMEASVNYGYGTKWCTSMKNSNSYFHKYSRGGVLLFVINRKNGVKYAFYSSPKEYSVWTTTDARIDSMETTVPFELLVKMKDWTNFDEVGPNYNYFEDEDRDDRNQRKRRGGMAILRTTMAGEGEPDRNPPHEATLDIVGEEDIMDADEEMAVPSSGNVVPTPTNDMRNVTISFRADDFNSESDDEEVVITEEYRDEEEGDWGMDEEVSMEESSDEIYVDITPREENMVGLGHSIHGSITEQGERTWENPYPNGPGGGFVIPEEFLDEMSNEELVERGATPVNRETAVTFEMEYDDSMDREVPQSEDNGN